MDKFNTEKMNIDLELRSLQEKVKSGSVPAEEGRKLFDSLRAKKNEVEQAEALASVKIETRSESSFGDLVKNLMEKRALTVNGTGAVGVISEIVKAITNKTGLLSKYKYFYGANASTVVPVLSPSIAVPAGQAEGATGISADSTAVLSGKSILPKAYVSILPVSAEALIMSGANIEAQLPSIFGGAFSKAMLTGSLTGDGTGNNMLGMFVNTALTVDVSCAESGAPKLIDLANLSLQVQDYMDDAFIVINPSLVSTMIAETTAESAPIKAELLAQRTIMGVPVIMSGLAPTTTTGGSVVAVAMSGSNYGVAVANDLIIDPIKVKGDTNTYFQATMFFNGTTIVPANGLQLKTI